MLNSISPQRQTVYTYGLEKGSKLNEARIGHNAMINPKPNNLNHVGITSKHMINRRHICIIDGYVWLVGASQNKADKQGACKLTSVVRRHIHIQTMTVHQRNQVYLSDKLGLHAYKAITSHSVGPCSKNKSG